MILGRIHLCCFLPQTHFSLVGTPYAEMAKAARMTENWPRCIPEALTGQPGKPQGEFQSVREAQAPESG